MNKYNLWLNSFNRIKGDNKIIGFYHEVFYPDNSLDIYLKMPDWEKNFYSDKDIFLLGTSEFELTDEMIKYITSIHNLAFDNLCEYDISNANIIKLIRYIINNNLGGDKIVSILNKHKIDIKNIYLENKDLVTKNIESGDLSYLSVLDKETFNLFFKEKYINFIKDLKIPSLRLIIKNELFPEIIYKSNEFVKVFKSYNLTLKLDIISTLKNKEIDEKIIDRLIDIAIEETSDNIYENNFTIRHGEFEFITTEILRSSYITNNRFNEEEAELLDIFKKLEHKKERGFAFETTKELNIDLGNEKYYRRLMSLYENCINYSKDSIINSLYNLENLKDFVTELKENDKYNILVANNEINPPITYYNNENQIFENFTIINQNNFCVQRQIKKFNQIYGYYTGIDRESIINIAPLRREFNENARNKNEIFYPGITGMEINTGASTTKPSFWWSIDDLNNYLYESQMYASIIIKARKNGAVLKPNVLIVMDKNVGEYFINKAKEKDLKILKLNKNKNTIIEPLEPISTHHNG